MRATARTLAGGLPFLEVFFDTPLSACEVRDLKGLFALARAGQIAQFTGMSAFYGVLMAPDLRPRTGGCRSRYRQHR